MPQLGRFEGRPSGFNRGGFAASRCLVGGFAEGSLA